MATENDRIDAIVKEAIERIDEQLPPKYGVAVIAFGLSEETEGIKVHGGGAGLSKSTMAQVLQMVASRWATEGEG